MRIARIRVGDRDHTAIGYGDRLVPTSLLDPDLPTDPIELAGLDPTTREELTAKAAELSAASAAGVLDASEVTFSAPVGRVSKVVCLALNYRAHADEGGFTAPDRPVVFLKGPNTLTGHDAEIEVPPISQRTDHEGELAVVIGRRVRHLGEHDWADAIAGYSVLNDLTARDLQLADIEAKHPWDLSKSIDGYGPMGPWLVTPDEVADPQNLPIEVRVDGTVRQHGNTGQMIFGVRELLIRLSALMTLEPGDVIATGTPDGIGEVPDGSTVEVTIGNLGTLRNRIRHTRGDVQ